MNNGFDIAWLLVGLFGSLSLVAVFFTVTEQFFRSRRLGNRAQTYETVFVAVEGLLEIQARPGPAADYINESEIHAKELAAMLGSSATVGDAIEALADAARARPQIATVLRGRDSAVRSITVWVDEQLAADDKFKRAHAVEVIASLRMRSCRGALAAATSDSDPVVRAAACRALAAIDPSTAIGSLLRIVETDGKWAADLLADLLARRETKVPAGVGAGPAGHHADHGHVPGDNPGDSPSLLGGERDAINARLQDWSATPALLRIADASMPASAKRALASALDSDDPEMRLRAVSLLRSQSVDDASGALERLVNDEVEAVRIAAIQALAAFKRDEHIMILAALVGDSSRMVRFAAAEALRLTKGGESLLQVMAKSTDGSVAEAASLALWQVNKAVLEQAEVSAAPEIELTPFVRQSEVDAVFKELKTSLELGFQRSEVDDSN